MKLTTTLLLAGLLLVAVSAANAAAVPTPHPLAQASQAQQAPTSAATPAQVPATPATSCKMTAGSLLMAAGAQPPVVDQSFTCGACSDSICVGAPRGQICGFDSGGYKHCNIFSGGFMCSTGGWECQCRSGALP